MHFSRTIIPQIITCLLCHFFLIPSIHAQNKKDSISAVTPLEDIIQSYLESREEDGDFDYNTLLDRLEYLQKHPININDEDAIDDLILLKPSQIVAIKNYIRWQGPLISIYELQVIPELDLLTIRSISPFIKIDANFNSYQVTIPEMLKYSDHQLFLRTSQIIESQAGYHRTTGSRYMGDKNKLYLRYRQSYENKLSIGLTAEKDPGETFLKKNNTGFDFYSFHAGIRNINKKIKELVLGDYTISFGQGLLMHSGFGVGKSPWASNIRKAERSIRPYSSVNESNFLRGAALNLRWGNSIESTFFGSIRAKDGNITGDTIDREAIFSSFQESGYHRTASELADKNKIDEKIIGASIKYSSNRGHVGINTLYNQYGQSLIRQNLPYNQFAFSGSELFQYSIDHGFQIRNFNFFGEFAFANPGTYAFLEGMQLSVDKKLDIAILYRNLDKSYPAINSNAFSENTLANNEKGIYIGAELRPSPRWKLTGYWDIWQHPWLRFNVQAPSYGNEQLSRLTYTIRRKMEAYIQYRNKTKQENSSLKEPLKELIYVNKKSLRGHFNYTWNRFVETRSRIEISKYDDEEKKAEHGWVIYQDIFYQSPQYPFSITSRLAYFNTDSYDAGIYAYENDLLYNFYVPNYNDRGWRYYINLKSTLFQNLTLEARFATSIYSDTQTVGSGNDLINGNTKSELKFQVKWDF